MNQVYFKLYFFRFSRKKEEAEIECIELKLNERKGKKMKVEKERIIKNPREKIATQIEVDNNRAE